MVKVEFWDGDFGDNGAIIISGISEEQIIELKKNFALGQMTSTPKGHETPTYYLCHDEWEDCTWRDYLDICIKFGAKPDLSRIPGIVEPCVA